MTDRPEHVPEKFWDATNGSVKTDAVLSSYLELEKKLSSTVQAQQPSNNVTIEAPKGITEEDLNTYTQRYAEKGALSDQDYKELAARGLPPSAVNDIIAGRTAKAESYKQSIFQTVGGEDAYKTLSSWAALNLSSEELTAYNTSVSGGNVEQAKLAVTALKSKFEALNGRNPQLVSGTSPSVGDGYASKAQMVADMRKPEYQRDPAFRAVVAEKVKHSSF